MPIIPFSQDPHYVASVRALLRLHELEVEGESESDVADLQRDVLERHWHLLSETERKRITGLSEDLYSITNPATTKQMTSQAQSGLIETYEARNAGKWDRALELLRRWGIHLEPALCSYMRACIWMEAGDSATASIFYRHAADSHEGSLNYEYMYLHALHNAYSERAEELARQILSEPASNPPLLVVKAAEIRFMSTRAMSEVNSYPVLTELLGVLEPIVAQSATDESLKENVFAMAVALVAFCHDHLGNVPAALEYYNKGIAANPQNTSLLIARGILRYGTDIDAVHDFEKAVSMGTEVVWPFFFLAHQYLIENRFGECLRACERAVEFATSDSARANLFEWIGIAKSELGMPPYAVREAFEEAMRLTPDNDRIRRNFRAYEEAVASQSFPVTWRKAEKIAVRALGHTQYHPGIAANHPAIAA